MATSNKQRLLKIQNEIRSRQIELNLLKDMEKKLVESEPISSVEEKFKPGLKQVRLNKFFDTKEETMVHISIPKSKPINEEPKETEIVQNKEEEQEIKVEDSEDGVARKASGHIYWSLATKLRVLNMLKKEEITTVFKNMNRRIPMRTLYQWKKDGQATRKKGSGRKVTSQLLDSVLFQWFIKQRARKLPVSEEDLISKAEKIRKKLLTNPDLEGAKKLKEMCFTNGWIYRFKKRHLIARRRVSTWSKKLASEIKKEIETFYADFDAYVAEKGTQYVMNIDESAIFFETTSNTTLEIKGQKTTGIFSTGANKQRCTVVIGIVSDGQSAFQTPPIIILKNSNAPGKGKLFCFPENSILKKDQKDAINEIRKLVSGRKLLLLENDSGWNNSELMTEHIIPFWTKNLNEEIRKKMMLVLDNCSCHTEESVFTALSESFNVLFFPPDCTPVLQPIDVAVVKPLKTIVRKKFHEHVTENFEEIVTPAGARKKTFKNPTKSQIITWILDGYKALTEQTMISGFTATGLLPIDGNKEEARKYLLEKKVRKFYVDNEFSNENLLVYPTDPHGKEILEILESL